MSQIDGNQMIKDLESLIEDNNKIIDDDMDGDNQCKNEIATLENVIYLIQRTMRSEEMTIGYKPEFLSWCESYEEEKKTFEELIGGNPADVEQLKSEYEQLTGEEYE